MKVFTFLSSFMILLDLSSSNAQSFKITNGPEDTTVCMNTMAECYCGFIGADPTLTIPNWRIVFRSDDGSIISDDTIDGEDILDGLINGLQWLPDLTSGDNNGTNSKLLVGPVNMTHNQSSYQCVFRRIGGSVISNVGTMAVVDPLSLLINVDKICATSIIISLNTHSHPSCGEVSHNVIISGNAKYPDMDGGSKYTIQSDILYNITVTSTYNSRYRIINKSVKTSSYKRPPNVIAVTPLSSTSFTINWTISDPSYDYTVIWTNLNTGVIDNLTVPENISSYTVTGLNETDNYNVSMAAVDVCGSKTSDPVTVYGPPGDITGVNISPDKITACSFALQWSKVSSDPVCGSVWYTVTISTEGGILIITVNTTMTSYNVTGLNYNTVYHVNVTASNKGGSSNSTNKLIMTNRNGLPSNPPNIISVPLNATSFTVNWTISDPNYDYTVIWTNLNTGMMNNLTVPKNINNYTVTELSESDHYNVRVAAVDVCGSKTSDPVTVYGYGPRAINIKIFTTTGDGLSTTGSCSSHQCGRVYGPVLNIEISFNGLSPTVSVGVADIDGNISGIKSKAPSSTSIVDDSEGTYGIYLYIVFIATVVAIVVTTAIYLLLRRDEIIGVQPIQESCQDNIWIAP